MFRHLYTKEGFQKCFFVRLNKESEYQNVSFIVHVRQWPGSPGFNPRSIWFGLVSLFNGISTLFRLFNAKAILLEEQYYLTNSWEDKGVHTFPKGICPKMNIIAQLENELAYYDSAVHHFNHYTPRTPPILDRVIPKTQKMVLDASLLNTQAL